MAFKDIFDEQRKKLANYFGTGQPGLGTFGNQMKSAIKPATNFIKQNPTPAGFVNRRVIQPQIKNPQSFTNQAITGGADALRSLGGLSRKAQVVMNPVAQVQSLASPKMRNYYLGNNNRVENKLKSFVASRPEATSRQGKVGRFVGENLPYALIPGTGELKGAGLMTRAGIRGTEAAALNAGMGIGRGDKAVDVVKGIPGAFAGGAAFGVAEPYAGKVLKAVGQKIIGKSSNLREGLKTQFNRDFKWNGVADAMDRVLPSKYTTTQKGEVTANIYKPKTKEITQPISQFAKEHLGIENNHYKLDTQGTVTKHLDPETGKLISWSTDNPNFAKSVQEGKLAFGMSTRNVKPSEGADALSNEARKYKDADEFFLYSRQGREMLEKEHGIRSQVAIKEWFNKNISNKSDDLDSYGMSHRPTQSGATADDITMKGDYIPKDAYDHPEYYFNFNQPDEYGVAARESWGAIKKIKGNPEAEITIYRASPSDKLNTGDWVTPSKKYAEIHAKGKMKVNSFKVKAKDIQFAGDDINEFGYFPKDAPQPLSPQSTPSALSNEARKYKIKSRGGVSMRTFSTKEEAQKALDYRLSVDPKGGHKIIEVAGEKPNTQVVKASSIMKGIPEDKVISNPTEVQKIVSGNYEPVVLTKVNGQTKIVDGAHRVATLKANGIEDVKTVMVSEKEAQKILYDTAIRQAEEGARRPQPLSTTPTSALSNEARKDIEFKLKTTKELRDMHIQDIAFKESYGKRVPKKVRELLPFYEKKIQEFETALKSQPLSPQSTQGAKTKISDDSILKSKRMMALRDKVDGGEKISKSEMAELREYEGEYIGQPSTAKSLVRKSPQQAIETTTKLEQTPKPLQVSKEGVSPNLASSPKDVSFTDNISPKAENVNVDPIQKIIGALKEAKPLSLEQKDLNAKLRKQQFAKMMSARGKTSGEKGYFAELGALKGGAKKVDFEAIRPNLEQKDIDGLFDRVNEANIGEWEKINAKASLAKLLSGEGVTIPTQNELKLLNDVFGNEFTKAILDKRSTWQKIMAGAGEVLNLPRSLMASFDLSAPLRQGVFLVGRPKQWVPAFTSMFKQFGSEKAFKAVQESIQAKPNYKIMRQARLAITDIGDIASGREEQFMSNLAEKIPVLGKGVRASGRAYTGFLNKLRADVFDDLYSKAKTLGQDSPEMADDIAKFVNSATGRGDLGKLNNAATALNGVFFSPRLMASRVNLLNPVFYAQLDPMVRKEALKSLLTFGAVATSALGLAKLGGAEVGTDPRSADFGKIKVGDTRYDILGGFQQYVVLASRLLTGKMVSSTTGKEISLTEGYKPTTRKDIIINFLQSKENPILSYLTNFAEGTTQLGQQFKPIPELIDRMIPMLAQDLVELADDKGWAKATGMALPAFFGTGVQTYGKQVPNMNEKGKLEWRNPPSIGERIVNKVTGQQASNIPQDQQKSLSDQRRVQLQNKADVDTAKANIMKNKSGSARVGDKSIWWDEDSEEIKTGSENDFNKYQFDKSGKKSELKNGVYYYRDKNGDPKSMTEGEYNTKVRKAKMDVAYNNKDYKGWVKLAEEELKDIEKQYSEADELTQTELLNDYQDLATKIAKYQSQGGFTKGKKGKKFGGLDLSTSTPKIPIRSAKKPVFKQISSPKIAIKTTKPRQISKSTLSNIR